MECLGLSLFLISMADQLTPSQSEQLSLFLIFSQKSVGLRSDHRAVRVGPRGLRRLS